MIGAGTWEAPINTIFFRGTGRVTITNINGEYNFKFEILGQNIPEIRVSDVLEERNTLSAVGETDKLPGQRIPFSLTFDGDNFSGVAKLPIVGKLKLKGTKIN